MMNERSRHVTFWVLVMVLGSLTAVLNIRFPAVVEGLYAQGATGFLNKISFTGGEDAKPLGYYTGMIEDLWVGPLTSVVTGGLFLFFCLLYLKKSGSFEFGAATFLYLLITKHFVLLDPPLGDGLLGVLSEPVWLVRHQLDWIGILQQNTYAQCGPLIYPESIYPKFIAWLLYLAPSPQTFLFINHLIVFLAGAVLTSIVRKILLEFLDGMQATLGAVLFLALPIFQCHVELLNMEIVCSGFATASLLMAIRRNFFMASAMAAFAMMVKIPGAIASVALLGACLLSFFQDPRKKVFITNLSWVLGSCLVALILTVIRDMTFVRQPSEWRLGFLAGWPAMKTLSVFWLFLVLSGIYGGQCAAGWFSKDSKENGAPAFFRKHYKSLVIFLMTASWFLLYIHAPSIPPRYTFLGIPFLLLFFVYLAHAFTPSRSVFSGIMIVLIFFSLFCSHGFFYKWRKEPISYLKTERSLEYRNLLKALVLAARDIEINYSDFTIGGTITTAQMLTFPEAGYVEKSLKDVFVYANGPTHEGIRPYPGLANLDIFRTIWVAESPNYAEGFPIGPKDKVLKEFWFGDKCIVFFMGGFAVEALAQLLGVSSPAA